MRSFTTWLLVCSFVIWVHAFSPTAPRYIGRQPVTVGRATPSPNEATNVQPNGKSSPSVIDQGETISPYHILHQSVCSTLPRTLLQRRRPFPSVIGLIKESTQKVLNEDFTTTSSILRIEHLISDVVDPLCWLQAQQSILLLDAPTLYFANAEDTIETAVIGSAITFQKSVQDPEYWDLVDKLPDRSNLYGGQRFDVEAGIAPEWSDFGKAMWLLPAVELRVEGKNVSLAVHLVKDDKGSMVESAKAILGILGCLSDATVPGVPPTTLPPLISRVSTYGPNLDGQEIFEKGVASAVADFEKPGSKLKKVVLARRMNLEFDRHANRNVNALDIIRKWKFASKPGGHMFYMRPGLETNEFFGCTPERLFSVREGRVLSEALAGTRPRGASREDDEELSRQLFESSKDQSENSITGEFIRAAFEYLHKQGWMQIEPDQSGIQTKTSFEGSFFIRRLRHLQHICQSFQCKLLDSAPTLDVIKYLMTTLHPTPAVGGLPQVEAMEFIREHESVGFDRGFYGGPVGYVSRTSTEIVVAIRSGLVSRRHDTPRVLVYAGAGIVPGSTVQGEWTETSQKLGVVTSSFPQSPVTLQSCPTPNVAWSTAFIEELIRNGVRQFYICPGSRSTPLVAAIARAVRSNLGTVHATSIHDERGAGFRAVGYGRGTGNPAAVVTSSGTAIANLYPAVIEASMEGIPMLILTADRPFESRDTGANQAIDQVKAYSATYIRWFRDILPPSDDVPVSLALSDACHGVVTTRQQRGPVHLNVQFRENLAPDGGTIRNDEREGSVTKYDSLRFTDTPGFDRWSRGGGKWTNAAEPRYLMGQNEVVNLERMIRESKRGLIVVGNIRKSSSDSATEHISETFELLSSFAGAVGFPMLVGTQCGSLRFRSPHVVPFADHILRSSVVRDNLKPDFVIQFGGPLVSSEISSMIKLAMKGGPLNHVLIHPHNPSERQDPEFTVSEKINISASTFVRAILQTLDTNPAQLPFSELYPLISVGQKLQGHMPSIVEEASQTMRANYSLDVLSEPEVMLSLSSVVQEGETPDISLFISNSMPVRDAEAFLYPIGELLEDEGSLEDVAVNRGASGIDGIIASASGFADSTDRPTTLVIGDVAALHDINSLHALSTCSAAKANDAQALKRRPLTTIVLNNDGGGIFSFLPVARHGDDVSFDEFFGTPTSTFSFEKGSAAFGLPFQQVNNVDSFKKAYKSALQSDEPCLIEAVVAPRAMNVDVHKEITRVSSDFLNCMGLQRESSAVEQENDNILPLKFLTKGTGPGARETALLIHGWMGDKTEWDVTGKPLAEKLPSSWTVVSIDLPGHGDAEIQHSGELQSVRDMLQIDKSQKSDKKPLAIDQMVQAIYRSLEAHDIDSVDAIAGYSLGGRVALAMKRASLDQSRQCKVRESAKVILLSTYPGELPEIRKGDGSSDDEDLKRLVQDEDLSAYMNQVSKIQFSRRQSTTEEDVLSWASFLQKWYTAPLWGNLSMEGVSYDRLLQRRVESLSKRGQDLASVLRHCSPPRHRKDDWRSVTSSDVLFLAGSLDKKYTQLGSHWAGLAPALTYVEMPSVGHALLVQAPNDVASEMSSFILNSSPCSLSDADELPAVSKAQKDVSPESLVLSRTSLGSPTGQNPLLERDDSCSLQTMDAETIGSLDFQSFAINLLDLQREEAGLYGISWGEKSKKAKAVLQRVGFIIQLMSSDGQRIGLGEVSPLEGLHAEGLSDVEIQLESIASLISEARDLPSFDSTSLLRLEGGLEQYIGTLTQALGIQTLLPSVTAGLEMCLLSLASQRVGLPVHRALTEYSPRVFMPNSASTTISLNGLITRGKESTQIILDGTNYDSWKVKIGFGSLHDDAMKIAQALQLGEQKVTNCKIRADANRAFNMTQALSFVSLLENREKTAIEYVEEPLTVTSQTFSLALHVESLELWHQETSLKYALDESMFDLAESHAYSFDGMVVELQSALINAKGCAAFILKPSLLGLELTLRLARVARHELGLGAVFTSSFDSGVGLAYAGFLSSLSDAVPSKTRGSLYSHGLATYHTLEEDVLEPSFGSYVNQNGKLNIKGLSRALYGLGLDELQSLCVTPLDTPLVPDLEFAPNLGAGESGELFPQQSLDEFEASTAASSTGREVTVIASLPLPFSAQIANARFTDLPQQPRWSPWISSVAYLDTEGETEWTSRVRGVNFRWRATSAALAPPYMGIRWESVSGLRNTGVVEFIATSDTTCLMKVRMALIPPRILSSLFRGKSTFVEEFLRNKILKWSMEMFRDVVQGDLALEQGDAALGDKLFGVVENKASAMESTMSGDANNQ